MIAEALGKNLDVTNQAIAIEYFHTASLIADDLPCMDDDDERRNKPSVHKVYGEAVALLASYALIAAGYGALADLSPSCVKAGIGSQEIALALENASYNTGLHGAAGGQYLDLFPPDLQESTLREILHKKTVSLFEISFVFGWLYGGGDISRLPLVKQCASHFGMAFQIADDLGDVEQDKKNGRLVNMANVFGIDAAKAMLAEELKGFHSVMEHLELVSQPLESLAARLAASIDAIIV
jgi:geranylgeranyl diphosphate synthase type II